MLRIFSRYVAVQLAAYVVDMGGFLLLTTAGIDPLMANVASKLAAGAFAFIAHRRFTFSIGSQGDGVSQLVKFSLLLLLNIPVSTLLLALFLPWISPPGLAKFIADVACVGLTFLAARYFVFTLPATKVDRK